MLKCPTFRKGERQELREMKTQNQLNNKRKRKRHTQNFNVHDNDNDYKT